jgi:hypothetical protein
VTGKGEDLTAEEIAEVRQVGRMIKEAIVEALPPEMREVRTRFYRAQRTAAKNRFISKRAQVAARTRRILEMLLTGHNQASIAQVMRITEETVSKDIGRIWPLPKAGRDNRYIVVRMSPKDLEALDGVAADMLLNRSRALEEWCRLGLEENATVARRLLRIVRKESAA